MRFETTNYFKNNHSYKHVLSFGTFYLCENFYVAEINEGAHIDHENLKELMQDLVSFYGKNSKIGVIANRINAYSTNPQSFNKIDAEFNIVSASAFVLYSDLAFGNASIEKMITNKSIKRCESLNEAIEWISNLEELVLKS